MKYFCFSLICFLFIFLSMLVITGSTGVMNDKESIANVTQGKTSTYRKKDIEGPTLFEKEDAISTVARKMDELQSEMIAFWQTHQQEMEDFAFQMKAIEEGDPNHTFLYAVKENALYAFDGVHTKAQKKIEEHSILAQTAFFRETQAFEWVAWSSNWFERNACTFTGEVYDDDNRLYAELYVFYSEEEPVTDEYSIVEPLGSNWYYSYEYRE